MQIVIFLALNVVAVSAFDLRSNEILSNPRDIIAPFNEIGGRIANGQDATEGLIPYQVGLAFSRASTSAFCGGSLISDKFVLTAAHCSERANWVTVSLGATFRTSPETRYTVRSNKIIIHPDWQSDNLMNDISLIEIPVTKLSAKIQIIKIPALSSASLEYANEEAIVSGWGRMGDAATSVTSKLQWGQVKIIENSLCALSYSSHIDPTKICIGTPDHVSSCQGDSGGPLALKSSGIQVGLISFGASRCEAGHPVAFTRISKYLEWIKEKTGISY